MAATDTAARLCSCAHHGDGSVTTMLCPQHADQDPCQTMAAVTGRRRRGSIVRGVCSACGWSMAAAPELPPCPDDLVWLRARSHRALARLTALVGGRMTSVLSFNDEAAYGIEAELVDLAVAIPGVNRARLKPVRYFHPWR